MQVSKWVTLGVGALCLVAVAGVLNAQHLYYMAAILLTLPGISWLLGRNTLSGLEFRRELPSTAWEGEEGELIYATVNPSALPRYFLSVQEPLPAWITPLEEEPPLYNVGANDTVRVACRVRFDRRGVYRVQAFEATATDPLGVFAFTRRVACDGELVVYPLPQSLRAVDLAGTELHGWQEFTRMALRGNSVDPDGVRQYTPGDPLRHIHWRQTARTGRLSVIEFEESQALHLVIALDAQRGTEYGVGIETTLEYGIRMAASVAQQAIQQGASVCLLTPTASTGGSTDGSDAALSQSASGSSSIRHKAPAEALPQSASGSSSIRHKAPAEALPQSAMSGRGQEHLFLMLDTLARVEADAPAPISRLIGESPECGQPGTTLLVITAKAEAALPGVISRTTANGAKIVVVYVDPRTFQGGRGVADPRSFLAELSALGAHVYTLRCHAQGVLNPEAAGYVNG